MGKFRLRSIEGKISGLDLLGRSRTAHRPLFRADFPSHQSDIFKDAVRELNAYFLEKRHPALPVRRFCFSGLTDFTRNVILATRRVPLGRTVTYTDFAHLMRLPAAYRRAVAQALGRNPFPIFFPCHRIVGDGGLGGFSSGLTWKRGLLAHEGVTLE